MMKREWVGGVGLTFLIAVLFFPVVAVAQYITIDYTVSGSPKVKGTVVTDLDWDVINAPANRDTTYIWNLTPAVGEPGYGQPGREPIVIDLGNGDSATIDGLSMSIKADPVINFGFNVIGGQSDTTFLLASNLIPTALINAQGSARATNVSVSEDGTFTGNFDGDKAYHAEYNGGTVFAALVDPLDYGGYVASVSVPSTPISGPVSSMQSVWSFTLSGSALGTSASGSSRFTITGTTIPEPATIALLGLGGLALFRKRRA